MADVILEARNVGKQFHDPVTIDVLKGVSFGITKGEFVSLVGRSGCGKSTLLYVLSTMDMDYTGDVIIDGQSMKGLSEAQLASVRNKNIGFVFQFHYLLNDFTVLRNVMLPGLKLGIYTEKQVEQRARERLDILGMADKAAKRASQLSGGEKQRVAIARALINDPVIIMGDEPTGNLDKANADSVFDIFSNLAASFRQTLLIVTHDPEFARRSGRVIEMADGMVLGQ
ncbi:MAG: ABC transporter ATP-binding protein [Candidatus Kapabacteria bacterium]|nr:ABC transporter ATP-binding protein [Candidatus Kapabacteria bacterium]